MSSNLAASEKSWVPLIGPSVEELRSEALAELKQEVIRSANTDLHRQEAAEQAHQALEQFFALLKASLRDEVKLQFFLL